MARAAHARPRRTADDRALAPVGRALRILDALATAQGSVGVTELARALGLAPSTTHRLLGVLVREGYVRRDPSERRYRRGPRFLRLIAGRPAPPPFLREAARPSLERLAERTGETAHLVVLDGLGVLSLDHVAGARSLPDGHAIGAHVPAHATAVGLALLAHHPEVAEAIVDAGLERWTQATIADPAAFERRLEDVRLRGYAVNVRGWIDDTAGVAAPVLTPAGEAVAAMGVSGPAVRLGDPGVLAALGPVVRAACRDVAARLAAAAPAHPSAPGPASAR